MSLLGQAVLSMWWVPGQGELRSGVLLPSASGLHGQHPQMYIEMLVPRLA